MILTNPGSSSAVTSNDLLPSVEFSDVISPWALFLSQISCIFVHPFLQNDNIGFAVLNKPGGVPCRSTNSNHAEDVVSMFRAARKERAAVDGGGGGERSFLSAPLLVEPETHGLTLAATRKEFCGYMVNRLAEKHANAHANANAGERAAGGDGGAPAPGGLVKTYRCLVCIKGERGRAMGTTAG